MDINVIAQKFNIEGNISSISRYGDGHIAVTNLICTDKKRYILQKINNYVFKNVDGLMNNIYSVTEYLKKKGIESLEIVKTIDDELYLKDGADFYRMYKFIEGTYSQSMVASLDDFYNAGKAFGDFQNQLNDFDASVLVETIENFHNTPKRFEAFISALNEDTYNRAKTCKDEIDFVLSQKNNLSNIQDGLMNGNIPLRVTHNDTKYNNVLLDINTKEVRAIVDLDTIMPGSMLYDFGDAIRSGATIAKEDEEDINKVHFSLELFAAFTNGFISSMKDTITQDEISLIPYSAYLITIECGIRFLTDYLSNDVYFGASYETHNLVRARNHFKLCREMQDSFKEMENIVNQIILK